MMELNTTKTTENISVKDAYIYAYPIAGMYRLLYEQIVHPNKKHTIFNEFSHEVSVATPQTKFIPAPNNDTTYSRAWLDLREGPVIIETPDTCDRYYSMQILDMYSDTITNLGKRLYGTDNQKFAIVGPDFVGEIQGCRDIIHCKTAFALAFLRILVGGFDQLEEVKRLQKQFRIEYLNVPQEVNLSKLPKYADQTFREYFSMVEQVMKLWPTEGKDAKLLQVIGNETHINHEKLQEGCEKALDLIEEKGRSFGYCVNNWRIARDNIGTYGEDYLNRAVVWKKGALANVPEESMYPSSFQDSEGRQLEGGFSYRLLFKKQQLPPVSQFWSLTMYRYRDALLTDNLIDRYSIGDRTEGIVYGQDGSLTIYIQNEKPKTEEGRANWLPAPKDPFYVTLRLYGPSKEAVKGEWEPPAIERVPD